MKDNRSPETIYNAIIDVKKATGCDILQAADAVDRHFHDTGAETAPVTTNGYPKDGWPDPRWPGQRGAQ